MRKNLSTIFLFLFFAFFSAAFAEISPCEIITIDGKQYYLYKVGSREALPDIVQRFGVSEEEILESNFLVAQRGLRKNETLKIPVKEGIEDPCRYIGENGSAQQQLPLSPADKKVLKVAYFMPFALNETKQNSNNDRFLEFYQGSLLAIEQLKKEGVSFEVYAYDTGTDVSLLNSILSREEIRAMDIFIGPVYTNQVKRVSDYSKRLGIRHVVPFSAQTTETATNPLLFQCNITPAQQAEVAARRFVQNFGTQPIMIVEFNEANNGDLSGKIKEFTAALKRELHSKNIAHQSVSFDENNTWAITNALSSQGENIVVLNTTDAGMLTSAVSLLGAAGKDFALFGTPDWSNTSGVQEKIFACKLYLYTPFYIDATDINVLLFRHNFTNAFGDYNQSSLPFYNFYGYDVSLYFLLALARYGREFERYLPSHNVKTLQSHFHFERVGSHGGFVNNGLFLLQYAPDKFVTRRPF